MGTLFRKGNKIILVRRNTKLRGKDEKETFQVVQRSKKEMIDKDMDTSVKQSLRSATFFVWMSQMEARSQKRSKGIECFGYKKLDLYRSADLLI